MFDREYDIPTKGILTIFGQHDMNQHQGTINTPLWTMDAARAVFVVAPDYPVELTSPDGQAVYVYGHNYGTPIPTIQDSHCFNILLTHQMVSDRDYWQGHVDYTQARALLDRVGYDLVVCGDNHNRFHEYNANTRRGLINCGSLMRSTTAQKTHKPVAYVYDTLHCDFEVHELTIAPPEEVFAAENAVTIRQGGEVVNPFVNEIQTRRHGIGGMDFLETLQRVARRRNANEAVMNVIGGILQNASDD